MRWNVNLIVFCGLLLLALVRLADSGAPVTGCRVGSVYDGDTVALICGDLERSARIVGLDAPEASAPRCAAERLAAQRATAALRQMVLAAAKVEVTELGKDRYGRTLIRLWLDGQDVAVLMIAAGHARAYDGGARAGWC
jgi:endonuclease YncB( thermonuclease family)